jgi:hypothetical protein
MIEMIVTTIVVTAEIVEIATTDSEIVEIAKSAKSLFLKMMSCYQLVDC